MNRWERIEHDARLDGAALRGTPCPVCGDCSLDGDGPCSEACQRIERRAELVERYRDDVPDLDCGDDEEPAWMATGGE